MSESITIKEGGNFKRAREYFDNNDCHINLSREIKDSNYFEDFLHYFSDIDNLGMSAYGEGVSYNFLYSMPSLKYLHLHTMYPVDFEKLKELETLSLWWNKKMITNFDKLQNLEHLSITEFDEKDLTKLSALTNLKSLSFKTAKIKSLKGIETLTNLKCVSFGGVRSLTDISDITTLQKLKYLEFDICWKLQDFSSIGELKELEVLKLLDCKNLASIKFVKNMPKLEQLYTLGTTIINDFNTVPAENVPVFFGSQNKKYNKQYPEKEIQEGQKSWGSYL
uniref:Leucine-rich repeat domain-containing protein n=1 Tax=Tenacibaculum sp. Pbs-1 TaxID=3238748 RepID=A0AB33KZ32_9FLAO